MALGVGRPVMLTPAQKVRIDAIVSKMGDDNLGNRARAAHRKALRDGSIRVR
jgi:hypothetical protein